MNKFEQEMIEDGARSVAEEMHQTQPAIVHVKDGICPKCQSEVDTEERLFGDDVIDYHICSCGFMEYDHEQRNAHIGRIYDCD
jgi:hypothetical protein